jgi:hypothetical protein
MNEYAALLAAVARLLNYLRDRDVVDEIKTAGNAPVQSWKSDVFKQRIAQTERALKAVKQSRP